MSDATQLQPSSPVAGAVLAGGAGRRMGGPKAMLPVGGVPMVERVARALRDAGCEPVIVVGDDGSGLGATGLAVIADTWPGEGPLGGVITAMRSVRCDVVVAACDLAFLDPATVSAVITAGAATGTHPGETVEVAIADDGYRHAALARWNLDALAPIERLFAEGERSLRGALDALRTIKVAADPRALRNVNTPGDLPGGSEAHRGR